MARDEEGVFCLKVSFEPGTPDPTRVFRAMSQLITALGHLDAALAASVGAQIKPTVLLEDVDKGSLRAWLRDALEGLDDGDVRDLNWRRMVGGFLVKGKRAVVRALSDRQTISDRNDMRQLQADVMRVADETGVSTLPTYSAITPDRLLKAASEVSQAVNQLDSRDTASFVSDEGEVPINPAFRISTEAVENLLTRETIPSEGEMILKVKKPDYLGYSMWEFRHDLHPVAAKISDLEWLRQFQARAFDVRPGDSLRAIVRTEVRYGYQSEVVAVHHDILRVIEIIPLERQPQLPLLPPPQGPGSVDME